jgi:hypothetical protein
MPVVLHVRADGGVVRVSRHSLSLSLSLSLSPSLSLSLSLSLCYWTFAKTSNLWGFFSSFLSKGSVLVPVWLFDVVLVFGLVFHPLRHVLIPPPPSSLLPLLRPWCP